MSSTRRLHAAKRLAGSAHRHISHTRSHMRSSLALVALLVISATAQTSVSVITARPDDPEAVYLTGAAGDGTADYSGPVQHAIDTVHDRFRGGIVFVPQGRYRLTRTIYLWPGVRMIGQNPPSRLAQSALQRGTPRPSVHGHPPFLEICSGKCAKLTPKLCARLQLCSFTTARRNAGCDRYLHAEPRHTGTPLALCLRVLAQQASPPAPPP